MSQSETARYHINYPTFAAAFVSGLLSMLMAAGTYKMNVVDRAYGDPGLAGWIFLYAFVPLMALFGLICIAFPFRHKLALNEDGYSYESPTISMSGLWGESMFNRNFSLLFGKAGLLVPLNPAVQLKRAAAFLGVKYAYGTGIPLSWFGRSGPAEIKRKIRAFAPYLFGVLETEDDFLKTIAALDLLLVRYLKGEIPAELFYGLYTRYYWRYIEKGENTVRDYHAFLARHTAEAGPHIAVWREVFQKYRQSDQPEDVDESIVRDLALLREIRLRYGRAETPQQVKPPGP